MKISTGPEFFEGIANSPDVFPYIAQAGQTHASFGENWDHCIGFEFGEDGGWVVHDLGDDVWEIHTLFRPKSRDVLAKSSFVLKFMFCAMGAREIVTRIPADLKHAKRLALAGGFKERYRRERCWKRDHGPIGVDFLGLTRDEWVIGNKELEALGHRFHCRLVESGFHQEHDDCAVHDAYVGLGIACAMLGQMDRGILLYNQWAAKTGFVQLELENGRACFGDAAIRVSGDIYVEAR